MLYKTEGIVIGFIKFKDTSIIAKIFTKDFGMKSYIINNVRSKTGKTKIAIFQILTILDLVVYNKETSDLNRISEAKYNYPYKSLNSNIKKSSMAFFLAEVLNKTLKEQTENQELFSFLKDSFIHFDDSNSNYENFHLQFLIQLTGYLGFKPSTLKDLISNSQKTIALSQEEFKQIEHLLFRNNEYSFSEKEGINNLTRRKALEYLLAFYQTHFENFGEIKSLKVLKEVFS